MKKVFLLLAIFALVNVEMRSAADKPGRELGSNGSKAQAQGEEDMMTPYMGGALGDGTYGFGMVWG